MRDEDVITDAAGAGTKNRLSPRAAVALVQALAHDLERAGLALTHVLPVAGIDVGTLRDRLPGGAVVGKTGTYGSLGASALAGVARTRRWGRVTFAVLNRGVPVPQAQRRQDAFVAALLAEAGAESWTYRRNDAPLFADATVVRSPEP
jgi:D-alanyl-D-alanine carboxypeptidase/D-alanyl-D-alanine-endopeptidase (penicillin-binding protein 4)